MFKILKSTFIDCVLMKNIFKSIYIYNFNHLKKKDIKPFK